MPQPSRRSDRSSLTTHGLPIRHWRSRASATSVDRPIAYSPLDLGIDAPRSRKSSIFLGRIVGVLLMRVNAKCAHQVRPPPAGPVAHGLDGIPESNCGGRSTETGPATIEALPEVVAEVGDRIPVFVDGGVRRGTDVFKALALGAKAVGIGRPFLWGLGAFGQAGVDRVLEILQGELKLAMG